MIILNSGNILESSAEAVVNTVNTHGVMGKGIALMFKDRYKQNYILYKQACESGSVEIGRMFVTYTGELSGPRLIVNFPTKKHWRDRSKLEWIKAGLEDLKLVIKNESITSIAVPPLGCGNGGLNWAEVRPVIEQALAEIEGLTVHLYEPTSRYYGISKTAGVEKLTIARALIAESVRRYWFLGNECSLLEIQKLAWFIERVAANRGLSDVLKLSFVADRYGPYSNRLQHVLEALDGTYLRSAKRIADSGPGDTIAFNYDRSSELQQFLNLPENRPYLDVLADVEIVTDGLQSALGLELLSTVDWLVQREKCELDSDSILAGLKVWTHEQGRQRKVRLFNRELIAVAIKQLNESLYASRPTAGN